MKQALGIYCWSMTSPQPRIFQNAVLRSLPGDSIERLRLKPVKLEADRRIAGPEDSMWWLYFIEAGSVALSVPLKDGSAIDTGVLGSRSMVGATALLGTSESLQQATVRSPGHAFVCSIEHGIEEFARAGEFHDLALACLHAQLMQSSQIAACNRCHDVEQRLCRWMLHCGHESSSGHIQVTQENLAEALGVRRTTVTLSMHLLRSEGLIDYSRGNIQLLDQARLEARACECYEALRKLSGAGKLSSCYSAHKIGPQAVPALGYSIHSLPPNGGHRETQWRSQHHFQR